MKHVSISCCLFKSGVLWWFWGWFWFLVCGFFWQNWYRLKVGKASGLCPGNVRKRQRNPDNEAWSVYCQGPGGTTRPDVACLAMSAPGTIKTKQGWSAAPHNPARPGQGLGLPQGPRLAPLLAGLWDGPCLPGPALMDPHRQPPLPLAHREPLGPW